MNVGVMIVSGVIGVLTLVVTAIVTYLLWDHYRGRNGTPAERYRRDVRGMHGSTRYARRNSGWLGGAAGLAAGGLWMAGHDGGSNGDIAGSSGCSGGNCSGGNCGGGGSCGGGCGGGGCGGGGCGGS
jgi:hypothetical protein